jgi:glutamine amidotransferase
MTTPLIGVIDYGVGNLASICGTLRQCGYRTKVSKTPDRLLKTDLLLLPGVGAFPAAREALSSSHLDDFLLERAKTGIPLLGICLGMQLLGDQSSEVRLTRGLGLIPGLVTQIASHKSHTGWNQIEVSDLSSHVRSAQGSDVYFNHSFEFCSAPEFSVASSQISPSISICAAIQHKNIVGLQFHPEKSQRDGRMILKNVLESMSHA